MAAEFHIARTDEFAGCVEQLSGGLPDRHSQACQHSHQVDGEAEMVFVATPALPVMADL